MPALGGASKVIGIAPKDPAPPPSRHETRRDRGDEDGYDYIAHVENVRDLCIADESSNSNINERINP